MGNYPYFLTHPNFTSHSKSMAMILSDGLLIPISITQ